MKIFVGSTNPVKIEAVKLVAQHQWPDVEVTGFSVPSEVAEQPRSDDETELGAINRAKNALAKAKKENLLGQGENLGVGLEGGVFTNNKGELWNTVWGAVVDEQGKVITVNGSKFKLSAVIAEPIQAGREMGPVLAEMTNHKDLRQEEGMIGTVTKKFTTRTKAYMSIVELTLGLWFGQGWDEEYKK